MTAEIPPEYHGREQTYLKHRVLKEYLGAWVQKLGSLARRHPVTLFYVDCFAGLWRSADQDRDDTSVAIGLRALSEALAFWRGHQQVDLRAHAIFVEADSTAFAGLQAYLAERRPRGIVVEASQGAFADHASRISTQIGSNPAFIFIDPTGWKGVGMDVVATVARGHRRDVMVNVMFDHINRFKDDERAFLRHHLEDFFGVRLDEGLSEAELMHAYREQLRMRATKKFVADLAVLQPTRRRTYFRLVLGADHEKAIELFREAEHKVCGREAAEVRQGARSRAGEARTGQTSLALDAPSFDADFQAQRLADLKRCREDIIDSVASAGPSGVVFGDLWPGLLERHHLRLVDLQNLVRGLAADGVIAWTRSGGQKQRQVRDDDRIARS